MKENTRGTKANSLGKIQSGKVKIMAAAEAVFAEKGYDGARVDQIAERAGVNKAHVYYYFDGKEALLREVMRTNIEELEALVENTFSNMKGFNPESFQRYVDQSFEFISKKANMVRILTIEAMKSSSTDFSLFEIFDPIFQKIQSSVANLGVTPRVQKLRSLVEYFFMDICSLLMFFTLRSKFAEYYHVNETELQETFSDLYKQNMIRYAERIIKNLSDDLRQLKADSDN